MAIRGPGSRTWYRLEEFLSKEAPPGWSSLDVGVFLSPRIRKLGNGLFHALGVGRFWKSRSRGWHVGVRRDGSPYWCLSFDGFYHLQQVDVMFENDRIRIRATAPTKVWREGEGRKRWGGYAMEDMVVWTDNTRDVRDALDRSMTKDAYITEWVP